MTSPAEDFRPISLSGKVTITGHDGRTCEVDFTDLMLDRYVDPAERIQYDVKHEPQFVGTGLSQRCVANPISKLGIRLKLREYGQSDPMFTMTFREKETSGDSG
jgi:hypothetical protein